MWSNRFFKSSAYNSDDDADILSRNCWWKPTCLIPAVLCPNLMAMIMSLVCSPYGPFIQWPLHTGKNVWRLVKKFRKSIDERESHLYCKVRNKYQKQKLLRTKNFNDHMIQKLTASIFNQYTFWDTMEKILNTYKNNILVNTRFQHCKNLFDKKVDNHEEVITEDSWEKKLF